MRYYILLLLLLIPNTAIATERLVDLEDQAVAACQYIIKNRDSFYIQEVAHCHSFIGKVHRRRAYEKLLDVEDQLEENRPDDSNHIKEIIDYFMK